MAAFVFYGLLDSFKFPYLQIKYKFTLCGSFSTKSVES